MLLLPFFLSFYLFGVFVSNFIFLRTIREFGFNCGFVMRICRLMPPVMLCSLVARCALCFFAIVVVCVLNNDGNIFLWKRTTICINLKWVYVNIYLEFVIQLFPMPFFIANPTKQFAWVHTLWYIYVVTVFFF